MMTGDSLVIGKAARPELATVGYPYEYLPAGMGGEQGPTAWRFPGVLIPESAPNEVYRGKSKKERKRLDALMLQLLTSAPIGAMATNQHLIR